MNKSVIRGVVVAALTLAFGACIAACSSGQSSTSAVSSSAESVASSSAVEESSSSVASNVKDFWEGSEYANPNRLTEDREFLIAYEGMDGVENVKYSKLEVSDTAETLLIPFSYDFVPFEWGGQKFIPALSQVEVKLGNGEVVQQTYLTMPGENMAWVMCKDKDTFNGSDVSVRMRAVINPTGNKEKAYSKWTDWQDLKVELGPAKGEERPVEDAENYEVSAQ